MARAKKAKISSKRPLPAFDAHIAAYWTNALTVLPFSSTEAIAVYIVVYWANYWLNTFPDTVERLEHEDANALAELVAPGVPVSAIRNRLNPLYAALEPSLHEDDPDARAIMRETALALSALHYAEITKATQSKMGKAVLLRERVMAEEPLARASVREEQDALPVPPTRIEALVHQRIAERLGISAGVSGEFSPGPDLHREFAAKPSLAIHACPPIAAV